ncbi:MAG: hypothetical protein ABSF98_13815 [Bryobacteraceae bacterium]|jgi:hypothetical protein
MNHFPAVDPIPLPAPIWLLKALHIVTLSLHFIAVEVLLGGLLVAGVLSVARRSPTARAVTAAIARRLPVVMTYVINLAVPPLLFAQVLYGRALYTSSVLIGAWWIGVIGLLMATYWLLYRFAARVEGGRTAWWVGLLAWAFAGTVARVLVSNMTLMLRPEVWQAMYQASATGVNLPTGDATISFRWLFMMAGGILFAGLWLIWLSGNSPVAEGERRQLARAGGWLAAPMAIVQALAGAVVVATQPRGIIAAMERNWMYPLAREVWLGAMVLCLAAGLFAVFARRTPGVVAWGAALAALLSSASMTLYRDGIRDTTLLSKGFDVWQRTVVTNWSVVGLFLVLFVAGLAVIGWLLWVVAQAQHGPAGKVVEA